VTAPTELAERKCIHAVWLPSSPKLRSGLSKSDMKWYSPSSPVPPVSSASRKTSFWCSLSLLSQLSSPMYWSSMRRTSASTCLGSPHTENVTSASVWLGSVQAAAFVMRT